MEWQLADAKNRFSELVEQAIKAGPQTVKRRGVDAVIVVSVEHYKRLTRTRNSFKNHLMNGPSFEGLNLERDFSPPRELKL